MLYSLLKFPAKVTAWFYIRDLSINDKKLLESNGPLLIAANHPNSFLDAIIVATFFKKPVHSLTRGDVFKKPFFRKLLGNLHMLPIYRVSEGQQNLDINYQTFELCKNIFRKNGLVLIFSEGGCVNEWKLRALKKGTARLALSSWDEGIPLHVLPLGINYSSFRRFGKNVELNFGRIISQEEIAQESEGKRILQFNEILKAELKKLVVEIPKADKTALRQRFYKPVPLIKKLLLFIPAMIGVVTHAPLYLPIKRFTKKAFNDNDHYDSVIVTLGFLLYPLYLLTVSAIFFFITASYYSFFLLIFLPLCARAHVELKEQMD